MEDDYSEFDAEEAIGGPELEWQASEYVFHKKKAAWHLGLFGIAAVLIAVAIITREWLSVGVFAVMALALALYANKPPRVLSYRLDDTGVAIGEQYYPYDHFRSFSLQQDIGWESIELEPVRRFMPRLTILLDEDIADQIRAKLETELPLVQREPDIIDRLARKLKF